MVFLGTLPKILGAKSATRLPVDIPVHFHDGYYWRQIYRWYTYRPSACSTYGLSFKAHFCWKYQSVQVDMQSSSAESSFKATGVSVSRLTSNGRCWYCDVIAFSSIYAEIMVFTSWTVYWVRISGGVFKRRFPGGDSKSISDLAICEQSS